MKIQIIALFLTTFFGIVTTYSMNNKSITPREPKQYSKTITQPGKALIVIEALLNAQKKAHVKIKRSATSDVKIHAKVSQNEVALQEKHYTEEQFYPFFVHQTEDTITIKPHVPGHYTIYVPKGTLLDTIKSGATVEISADLQTAESDN